MTTTELRQRVGQALAFAAKDSQQGFVTAWILVLHLIDEIERIEDCPHDLGESIDIIIAAANASQGTE